MPTWLKFAWLNRERIVAAASKLRWSRRTWMRLGAMGVVAVGVYLAATHGYLQRWNPTGWSGAQWAQLVVNITGLALIFFAQHEWWNRQDQVWDEVDALRAEVDKLREFTYDHVHEEEQEDEEVVQPVTGRPPLEPATTILQAVRQAPVSDREPAVVQRQLGKHTFNFRQ